MANKFGFIFLLTLVALLSCESRELEKPLAPDHHPNSTTGPLSQQFQFKNFMFIQKWPPTYCETSKCAQNPDRFIINGLWPLDEQYAGENRLTDAILEAHENELLKDWPDLEHTTFTDSKQFWHREYEQYGVYCTTRYTANLYITKALDLGNSVKAHSWLADKHIVPNARKQYKRRDIIAAIESFTRVTPDLQCSTIGGKSYLLEIRVCFDDKLVKYVNCGGRFGRCGTQIYYPPSPAGSATSEEILEITEDLVDSI